MCPRVKPWVNLSTGPLSVTINWKTVEHYFTVVLFVFLVNGKDNCSMGLTKKSFY